MRVTGIALAIVGVIMVIGALVNYFMLKILLFHHFTSIALIVGVVAAAVGVFAVVSTNRA